MKGTAAWRTAWRQTDHRQPVALVRITSNDGATVIHGATSEIITPDGQHWEPLVKTGAIDLVTQFMGTDVALPTCSFDLTDQRTSVGNGALLSAVFASADFRGGELLVWLWERSLTSFSQSTNGDGLRRFTGVVQTYHGRTGIVELSGIGSSGWNQPIDPRTVTRSEFFNAPDEALGAVLTAWYGRVRGLPFRKPHTQPYGITQHLRELMSGGRRAVTGILVDTGKGGGVGNPPAKVVIAGHRVTQLGVGSTGTTPTTIGDGGPYGTPLFLQGEDGTLQVLEVLAANIFNAASGAGFTVPDTGGGYAWQPIRPAGVEATTALNPRALLDQDNESRPARINTPSTKLAVTLPSITAPGPIVNPGDGLRIFAALVYSTTPDFTGTVTFQLRNRSLYPVNAVVTVNAPATGGAVGYVILPLSGSTEASWFAAFNYWDFSQFNLEILTGTPMTGAVDMYLTGAMAQYQPPQSWAGLVKQRQLLPVQRVAREHRRGTHIFQTYEPRDVMVTITELRGKFFGNLDGVPDDAAGTYTGTGSFSGSFVAWEDDGTVPLQARVQALDAGGGVLWGANGALVSLITESGKTPAVCSDGAGGCFVAFCGNRTGAFQLYAQHFDGNGAPLWGANGVVVASDPTSLRQVPVIITDGAGGCIVSWIDGRAGGAPWGCYAQRVNSNGTPMWTANGVALTTNAAQNASPIRLVPDGSGGAFAAFFSTTSNTLNVTHLAAANGALWAAGLLALAVTNTSHTFNLSRDGAGGVFVAYSSSSRARCSRYNSAGTLTWGPVDCFALTTSQQCVVLGASNDAVVLGFDGSNILRAQRLRASDGALQWGANGTALTAAMVGNIGMVATTDGTGGAVAAFTSTALGASDVYAARVKFDGTTPWGVTAVQVCVAAGAQILVAWSICADGSGGAVITWGDSRSGNSDVYAQQVTTLGGVAWPTNGVGIAVASGVQTPNGVAFAGALGPQEAAPAGTASLIEKPPDVAHHVLAVYGKVPESQIQKGLGALGSFVDARLALRTQNLTPMVLAFGIAEAVDVSVVLGWIAAAACVQFVRDEFDGTWLALPWSGAPAATYTVPLSRADLIDPENAPSVESTPTSDVPSGVVVQYGWDALAGAYLHEASCSGTRSVAGHAGFGMRDQSLAIVAGISDQFEVIYPSGGGGTHYFLTLDPCANDVAALYASVKHGMAIAGSFALAGIVVSGIFDQFWFTDAGGQHIATLLPGAYRLEDFAAMVQAQMVGAGGVAPLVTYDRAGRHLNFTLSGGGAARLGFLPAGGPGGFDGARSCGAALGFHLATFTPSGGTFTSEFTLDEGVAIITADVAFDWLLLSGTSGMFGTRTDCGEVLGFVNFFDRTGATGYVGDVPKGTLEASLAQSQGAFNAGGRRRDLPVEGRAILDTPTAIELRNRLVALMHAPRPKLSIPSDVLGDAQVGDVMVCDPDMDLLKPYPVPGTAGSWQSRALRVIETHQHVGDSFHTEVVAIDMTDGPAVSAAPGH